MNKSIKIISVVGARPNFIKISPFINQINKYNNNNNNLISHILVHTGQHYDDRMSKDFFDSLNIPNADINLGIGSGSHAEQVGRTMIEFEKILIQERPDWVVVVGDVNATLACSVSAKKLNIKVCHIEAGLRSGDESMPEEINRLVTDRLSDLLLTPDKISIKNLEKEGIKDNKIKFVGNIMIDTLKDNMDKASDREIEKIVQNSLISNHKLNYIDDEFALITLHRPSNVDDRETLKRLIDFFSEEISQEIQIIWPVHPRTQKQLKKYNLWDKIYNLNRIYLLHPLGYHDLLKLNMNSKFVFTDSGGLQEECTVIGTPCITLRWNTERPITLTKNGGVSVLVGNDINLIRTKYNEILTKDRNAVEPELWDGQTAKRCLDELINYTNKE